MTIRSFSYLPCFFFFNDTATTEIYTLSLHDALPISWVRSTDLPVMAERINHAAQMPPIRVLHGGDLSGDRKSTRLNSSHSQISYAVFCLKKKNNKCIEYNGRVEGQLPSSHTVCQPHE